MSAAPSLFEASRVLHERHDRMIRRALKHAGRTEVWLQLQVAKRYETSSAWEDLSVAYKQMTLVAIEAWVAEEQV